MEREDAAQVSGVILEDFPRQALVVAARIQRAGEVQFA